MDIHLPSAAGSSGTPSTESDNKSALELMAEKDKVEEELKALGEVLDSHRVNMNTSLTTFDGYPRDDIDVAQIRITRARIIHLRNDWKALMNRIEKALHVHFAAQNGNGVENGSVETIPTSVVTAGTQQGTNETLDLAQGLQPFAKINSVMVGSPADQAGLKAGDELIRFGDANWLNHEKLSRVARVVQNHEGAKVEVFVSRRSEDGSKEVVTLELVPHSGWGGRGSLGCHLLPL